MVAAATFYLLGLWVPAVLASSLAPAMKQNMSFYELLQTSLILPEPSRNSTLLEPVKNWTSDGSDFPKPLYEEDRCNYDSSYTSYPWVCDPDKILQQSQVADLSNKIQDILEEMSCQCRKSPGCSPTAPMGRFSIGIAIMHNIDGSDSPFTKVQKLSAGLRRSTWKHMKRCDDMLVIALMTSGRAVYYSTDPVVAAKMTSSCIKAINDATREAYESEDWDYALRESLEYTSNALQGGRCGTKSGLSTGQIVGIVFGVVAGVAMIVGLILCCIGFCRNWECVVGTCIGVCIGIALGTLQACINALIFSCVQAALAACGCEDCCECEPCDCLPEDFAEAGGGMEF